MLIGAAGGEARAAICTLVALVSVRRAAALRPRTRLRARAERGRAAGARVAGGPGEGPTAAADREVGVSLPGPILARCRALGWAPSQIAARARLAAFAFVLALTVVTASVGVGFAAVVAVSMPLALWWAAGAVAQHRLAKLDETLPLVLDELARVLRSGASLGQALGEAARTTPGALGVDLRMVADAVATGEPLAATLERWARRRATTTVPLAVAALLVGIDTGGASARAIDGVAATLRDRLHVRHEVRALASQARLSALVMSVAPLAFCALLARSDAGARDFLLRSPIGLGCLVVGLAVDAAAAGWMRRLAQVGR